VSGEARPPARIPLRFVAAVFLGNGLAFYDFLTFSYFSVYIGRTFFPSHDAWVSLIASQATFWIGFVMRPVGALVLGPMGDRIGRKPAMLFTFFLLGIAIVGMALTPSYAAIGPAAPVIIIAFRLVQGFALGGEVGPSTAYMAESAPPERRGFYLSMQFATQDCATLLAGLVGIALAATLSDAQLEHFGWRVALLIGASIVPFGLWMRARLPETLEPARAEAPAPRVAIAPFTRVIVLGILMLTAGTIGSYTIGNMTTYALSTLKLSAAVAFGLTIVNGLFSILSEVASGWLSDRYGRKPVMIVPAVLLLAAIFPCFWVMQHAHSLWALYGAESVMVVIAGVASVPPIVAITEQLPAAIRSGGVAMIYAVAISLFGGSTSTVITLLIRMTGNPLAPALYWTAASVVGVIAMVMMKESAPVKTRAIPRSQ
jgi:MFS transporter, MHS family, citrate/tricarballylate:H+ symporter